MSLTETNDLIHELQKQGLDIKLDIEDASSKTDAIEIMYLKDIVFSTEFKNEKQRDIKLKEALLENEEYQKWSMMLFIAKKELEENKIEIEYLKRKWKEEIVNAIDYNVLGLE